MDHRKLLLRLIALMLTGLLYACGGGGGSSSDDDSGGGGQPMDSDSDGIEDATDIDDDNDGLIDIASLEQLDWMRNDLTGATLTDHNANVMMDGCPNTGCMGYELVADLDFDTNGDGAIDANDIYFDYDGDGQDNGWLPIGTDAAPFLTTFEGNNQKISNLYIRRLSNGTIDTETSGSDIGLFGTIDGSTQTNVEIRNIVLDGDADLSAALGDPYSVLGGPYSGALAGRVRNSITITNVSSNRGTTGLSQYVGGLVGFAEGSITIRNSHALGDVIGDSDSGGLVGGAESNIAIENSYATGNLLAFSPRTGGLVGTARGNTVITDSYATGNVRGFRYAGGLVGLVQANATLTNTYATGNVTISGLAGGLVGSAEDGTTITNSYATGDVTTTTTENYTGGLLGRALDNITITGSYATGNVTGNDYTGGLVGQLRTGSSITNSYATGAVVGADASGGLVGSVNLILPADIETNVSTIINSFAIGAVSTSGNNDYVGGLIGISYHMTLNDSFATGTVSNADRFVGGLIGDANNTSLINRSFAANTVTGTTDVGGLIGYSKDAEYVDNDFTSDSNTPALPGVGNDDGGNTGLPINGNTLANFQSATSAGEGGFFTNWGVVWDFGTNTQLPGLIIDGVVYRDGDANGELD